MKPHKHFLATEGQSEEKNRSLFATLRRREIPEQRASAIFAAAPGDEVGPTRVAESYVLDRVLSVTASRSDEPTLEAIKEILFREWLAERRRKATIEWNWGNAVQTT